MNPGFAGIDTALLLDNTLMLFETPRLLSAALCANSPEATARSPQQKWGSYQGVPLELAEGLDLDLGSLDGTAGSPLR